MPQQTVTPTQLLSDPNVYELTVDQRLLSKLKLAYFHKNVLGYTMNWHLTDWYNILQDKSNEKIIFLAPRNHAKSTAVTAVYSAWEIGNNPNVRIIIVSNASTQAQAFLRVIKSIIEEEEKYQEVFGMLKPPQPDKWSEKDIIVNRSELKEKDPTVATVGAGGAILSKRADIIICDDILNQENTRTPEQREKILRWFRDTLMPVLDPEHGRLIWVSTAWNLEDLSHVLFKDPTFDVKRKYKAIIKEAKNQKLWDEYKEMLYGHGKKIANQFYEDNKVAMLKGAKVLWEDRFDYKKLYDERISSGIRSFNLMYQNQAVSDETAVIKEAWIEQCKDVNRRLIDKFEQFDYDMSIQVITQGTDLAVSETEMANETVITTLGRTSDNKIIVLNAIGGRWSPQETRNNIKGQNDRFNPALILVENNAFQASMVKDLQNISTAPIRGFTTTGEKFDEFVGINSIAVALENKQVIIPADPRHPRTMAFYERLKTDMISFPSGHTGDWLMSFWFAFVALRSLVSDSVVVVKSKGR